MEASKGKISIVGSGLIGQSWATIFVGSGYNVTIYDIDESQVKKALVNTKSVLQKYESQGCLRGELTAEEQSSLINGSSDLQSCMKGAIYVQECVPEHLELKKKVFIEMDKYCEENMIMASSSSCINSSHFTEDLKNRSNILVAHPVNPPYFIPLVEIIPAPWTKPEVTKRTRILLEEIGQSPITLMKEVPGFALNRIQYAIINECWSLVKSGVLSTADVDKVMYEGLGRRYAFIGPLETMRLNADGVVDYCKRYGDGAYNVQTTFTPPPVRYDIPTAEVVEKDLAELIAEDKTVERKAWRDSRLAALDKLKRDLN